MSKDEVISNDNLISTLQETHQSKEFNNRNKAVKFYHRKVNGKVSVKFYSVKSK